MRRVSRRAVLRHAALLVALVAPGAPATAQAPDSSAARPADALSPVPPSPSTALTRSLLVPGWGQIGNRRPVRAAVAAGAVAGAVAYLVVRQVDYGRYRRAALYAGCLQAPDRDVCTDTGRAEADWQALGQPAFAAVRAQRDAARGRRDVAGLLVAVAWAAQALDAYVGAELADFDVGEDLSLASPTVRWRVAPAADGLGIAARVRW